MAARRPGWRTVERGKTPSCCLPRIPAVGAGPWCLPWPGESAAGGRWPVSRGGGCSGLRRRMQLGCPVQRGAVPVAVTECPGGEQATGRSLLCYTVPGARRLPPVQACALPLSRLCQSPATHPFTPRFSPLEPGAARPPGSRGWHVCRAMRVWRGGCSQRLGRAGLGLPWEGTGGERERARKSC